MYYIDVEILDKKYKTNIVYKFHIENNKVTMLNKNLSVKEKNIGNVFYKEQLESELDNRTQNGFFDLFWDRIKEKGFKRIKCDSRLYPTFESGENDE